MDSYASFVANKLSRVPATGITSGFVLPDAMFPHMKALTSWALRRGRAAIFADTGLSKSRGEVAFCDIVSKHTGMPTLILAPLAVAAQTVAEGASIGVHVTLCREATDVRPGVNITNYDRLHKFDCSVFGGVAPDESGIIKHHDAKTFRTLCNAFKDTPFKLPCSATPAPNDWTELGTHAEFLGVCTRAEMLAEFFTHDGGDTSVWRLKGHARSIFWKWVSTWGAMVRRPSDLGFDDTAFILPPLHYHEHTVEFDAPLNGMLFAMEAATLSERRDARRASMAARVSACAAVVNAEPNEAWVVWGDLNDECDLLESSIDGAVQIAGKDDNDTKEQRLIDFAAGRSRVLVSKGSITGRGLNWQHAARMAFVGVTDSFETYYQCVRREWRFGQKRPVHVHIFASRQEGAVVANLKRKERDAIAMAEALGAETRDAVMAEVVGESKRETNAYAAAHRVAVPSFLREAA